MADIEITVNGKTYNIPSELAGYGFFKSIIAGTGDALPTFTAFIVDALTDFTNGGLSTSTTSVTIGIGAKVFTLGSPTPLVVGMNVKILDNAAPTTNNMFGTITTINNATPTNPIITVDVTAIAGSGTLSAWAVLTKVGDKGDQGAAGSPPDASETVKGIQENGTVAEINTGTLANRTVTLASLSDSNYGLGKFTFNIPAPEVADGVIFLQPVAEAAGENIIDARAYWAGVIGTGAATSIQLRNTTSAADVFSTNLTIDDGERSSQTAAAAVVINTAEDDITLNDVYQIDIDVIGSTVAGTNLVIEIFTRIA